MAAPKKTNAKEEAEEVKVEEAPVEEAPEVEPEVAPEPEEAPAPAPVVVSEGEVEACEHLIAKHEAKIEGLKARLAELKK